MNRITIVAGNISMEVDLNDSPTARKLFDALPIEGNANIWGDEVYFEIPVLAEQEAGSRADVRVGELGYWPVGRAFYFFFGPTPASTDQQPRAASPVNILGQVMGDATQFRGVQQGTKVTIQHKEMV